MAVAYGQDELNRGVFTSAPVIVTLSVATARSTQLALGVYTMISDVTCWFLAGTVAVNATTASNYLPAGCPVLVNVTDATANGYIAAIAGGAGNLYIMSPK